MPPNQSPLFLHEEIMLLALRDEKGTFEFGSMYNYALAGAILAELLLAGRISVESGKKKLIDLMSREPMGDPVIDECLQEIVSANVEGGHDPTCLLYSSATRKYSNQ